MTQSSCAILERKMGGNGGRNLAAQRSKQLFWNRESVPWASTLPEFNRMKRTGALLLLHLQTAFVWVSWVCFCQGTWCALPVQGILQAHLPALATPPQWDHHPPSASPSSGKASSETADPGWTFSHPIWWKLSTEWSSYKSNAPKVTSRSGNTSPDNSCATAILHHSAKCWCTSI